MNLNLDTVTVVPLTSAFKSYPTRFKIKIDKEVYQAAVDQIRTISKGRLQNILRGKKFLNDNEIKELKKIIFEMLIR